MATYKSLGYEYEFVYKVPSKYFCQQCKHVARSPSITSCCGECLCKACTNLIRESNKSCLFCKKKDFEIEENLNHKDKIEALTVYCSLKDKGCEWTGQLQYLNAHLSNDCLLDRIKCDQCQENVQRSKLDTHLTQECPEREYMCKYCNYKATYKMVTELHFEVCTYYILNCPNRCGATFERGDLEDHMKMCAQERIQCEFNYAGCQAEFQRDQEKEHMEQNTQLHLALVAAALRKQQQRLLDLTSRENEASFHEPEGIGDDQGLQGWPQVQEVNLQHRYEEFENRINERAEQVEQLLRDRELQDERRRDDHPDVHQPWTCSMVLAIIAAVLAVLLAILLGLSQQFPGPGQSLIENPQPSPRENTPDSNLSEMLDEIQSQIRELKNSIHNLQQREQLAPTIDEASYNERFTKLEDEIRKVQQLLEDSLQELTLKVTSQYTETQQDYKLVIGNLKVKIQEIDKKLGDLDLRLQSQGQARDKKIEELIERVDGMGDLRARVVSLEQKMSELSAKLVTLEQGLKDLKRQFDELPSHRPHHHPPRHHHPHPPHPHHHPPHHHHHHHHPHF